MLLDNNGFWLSFIDVLDGITSSGFIKPEDRAIISRFDSVSALISTFKVISDEYKIDEKVKQNKSSKNYNFFELDNLNTRNDFIKLRAEADSEALKIKFSNKKIYLKNAPKKPSCKKLYDISEKIRYEILGSKMLRGISNNIKENYTNQINLKRKDQLKSKEDVNISEAFELYMLKNFLNIKLNRLSEEILGFWEKELNS